MSVDLGNFKSYTLEILNVGTLRAQNDILQIIYKSYQHDPTLFQDIFYFGTPDWATLVDSLTEYNYKFVLATTETMKHPKIHTTLGVKHDNRQQTTSNSNKNMKNNWQQQESIVQFLFYCKHSTPFAFLPYKCRLYVLSCCSCCSGRR